MRRQRTTAILVLAILHLVGGGLGLIISLCGCGGLVMGNALGSIKPPTLPARPGQPPPPPPLPSANDAMKYLNDRVPGYLAFTIVGLGLSFLLDIMLISGGIGLLNMKLWARWLSLVYAPISILVRIGSFVYQLIWVMPATEAFYAKSASTSGFASLVTISSGVGLFLSLVVIIYPITVLVILLLPSTAAAFRGEPPARADDWREEEENDEDRWR
jgi:hypothetical protein